MVNRDPMRFRKSEVRQRPSSEDQGSAMPPLPKPKSAREFAYCILDEHKQTGEFVSDLLEDRVDRAQSSFLTKPPLAGFFGKSKPEGAKPQDAESTGAALLSKLDRRFVTELANGVVRRQVTLDAILRAYVMRPRQDVHPRLWLLLQLGVYQLVMMTGVPAHAAVGETVELGHFINEPAWCSFTNGVLRTIGRDMEANPGFAFVPDIDLVPIQPHRDTEGCHGAKVVYRRLGKTIFQDPVLEPRLYIAEAFCLPTWMLSRWSTKFSTEELFKLGEWFSCRHPLTLRVNRLRTTRDELLARFEDVLIGEASGGFGPGHRSDSIWYDGRVRVVDLPGFVDGHFTVQDETAMSASELLAPQPGETVLDLCAAPGTKSTHLAELMNNEGRIFAADVDFKRLQRVTDNATRLGHTIIAPVTVPDNSSNLPQGPFDAILIDAPCSNTGVMGKRPEVRNRLHSKDIYQLAAIQLRLLRAASEKLKSGGRLVYSTCSIESEENSAVVREFLATAPSFELIMTQEFIPGRPSDGGFQALLRKHTGR